MNRAAAIGDERRLGGYALAGARVAPAVTEAEVAAAWDGLGEDVSLLLLTQESRELLGARLEERPEIVWVVVP